MEVLNQGTLEEWAGADRVSLALLFTDIVNSTAIGQKLGDSKWIEELGKHFARGRSLATEHNGYVIKVIGDAFMIAFKTSTEAVSFAVEFSKDTGVDFVGIRVGIHLGQVKIVDNDVYGLNVNEAARIQTSVKEEGIHVSDPVKKDYERYVGSSSELKFNGRLYDLKNFGKVKLWSLWNRDFLAAITRIRKNRHELLPPPVAQQGISPTYLSSQTLSDGRPRLIPPLSPEEKPDLTPNGLLSQAIRISLLEKKK